MKFFKTAALGILLLFAASLALPQRRSTTSSPALQSMERKLQHLETNAQGSPPDPAPTAFTEEEVNAYLASGAVRLPRGVQRVRMEGLPGVIAAQTRVDFDQLTQGARSANPLLALFTGVHDVQASAHAHGERGQAYVHIDRVAIDNVEVPRMALEFFIDHYIRPKYPEVGIDTRFRMPERIDTAVVGEHKLTVVQK